MPTQKINVIIGAVSHDRSVIFDIECSSPRRCGELAVGQPSRQRVATRDADSQPHISNWRIGKA